MTAYRLDSKGRVVSIDGEVMVPTFRRRIAHRIRREVGYLCADVQGVRRSRR